MSLLEILWIVWHFWLAGARFLLNFDKHWDQILLYQLGGPPVTLLGQEGVTQVEPLSMVLYNTNLVPLEEKLRAVDLGLLSPFYADDASFDGLLSWSAQLLKLLMERGQDGGISPSWPSLC